MVPFSYSNSYALRFTRHVPWPRSVTVGQNTRGFPGLPLWYAHYDNVPSFSDSWAYEFGGWSSPAMKQYYDSDSGPCGVSYIDVNWYPN